MILSCQPDKPPNKESLIANETAGACIAATNDSISTAGIDCLGRVAPDVAIHREKSGKQFLDQAGLGDRASPEGFLAYLLNLAPVLRVTCQKLTDTDTKDAGLDAGFVHRKYLHF